VPSGFSLSAKEEAAPGTEPQPQLLHLGAPSPRVALIQSNHTFAQSEMNFALNATTMADNAPTNRAPPSSGMARGGMRRNFAMEKIDMKIGTLRLSALTLLVAGGLGFAGQASAESIVGGAVNANGTVQGTPTSYTVTHPSTGRYILMFTSPITPNAECIFQGIGLAVRVAGLGESSTECDVTFAKTTKKGAAVDTLFNFIAVNSGP
jgi:hypothetical protein